MRDFEEDFEFEPDVVTKTTNTYNVRKDSHRTVTFDPNYNAEREARLAAHQKRVQREMEDLGLVPGYKSWERSKNT